MSTKSAPRILHAASVAGVVVVPALGGIEIRPDIAGPALGFLLELRAVEGADGVISTALDEHPLLVLHVAVHGQFEEVRALEAVADRVMLVLPLQQILRGEDVILPRAVEHHHPMLARRIPEDFRVSLGH
jgi:hypothetical protein